LNFRLYFFTKNPYPVLVRCNKARSSKEYIMRPWLPVYEGDGYLRQVDVRLAPVANRPAGLELESPRAIEQQARAQRNAAVRAALVAVVARIGNWLRDAPGVEAERYLSSATDLADLERRLAEIERRGQAVTRV
jgi:hypothetical protein